jgi:hypothetical protein
MAKGSSSNIIMIVIVVAVAYFAWKKGYLNKIIGGIGGAGGAGGAGGTASDGTSANGAPGMDANGNDALQTVQDLLRNNKSGVTACSNGNCKHIDGDNVSVHCSNGVCHSNAAYSYNFTV